MPVEIHRIHKLNNLLRQAMTAYLQQNKVSRQFPLDEQRIEQMLENMIHNPAYALWVAYYNGVPVGFMSGQLQNSLFHDRTFAFDLGWYVLPGYQGRGIGRQLMDTYTNWAKEQGASVAHMSVVFGDEDADQSSVDKLIEMDFELWGYLTRKVLD